MSDELFLIDFENVPGVDITRIGTECKVIVFTGANQKSVPLELVAATQRFGDRLQWRRLDASGHNALDFFIACELGRVQASESGTQCTVLSNDKGFDPLLRYLNSVGVKCRRIGNLAIPKAKPTAPLTPKSKPAPKPVPDPANFKVDNYAVILADLKKRGASRPRRVETLKSTIRATVKNAKSSITEAQLETLIKHLQINAKITIEGAKVSYSL